MSVRTFTKNQPCNKIDIWNCFRGRRGFKKVAIVEAQAEIGRHVPGHLVAQGKADRVTMRDGTEALELTDYGKQWLTAGTERYIRNQTKKGYTATIDDVSHPLKKWVNEWAL